MTDSEFPHPVVYILSAEYVGEAKPEADGYLVIGGLRVPWHNGATGVYVRRSSKDLSVMEIHMVRHDGLAQEELDRQNEEAERYTLGPKEYWRGEIVGKWTTGPEGRVMTDDDFEEYWSEGYDLDDEDDEA